MLVVVGLELQRNQASDTALKLVSSSERVVYVILTC